MNLELPQLLRQLWQQKAAVTATGLVTYQPKAERTLRDIKQSFRGIRNVLVVRLDAIGDNFLFMDGFRKLRKLFPEANLVALTYSECKPIYDRCPFVNKTLFVERVPLNSNKAYREACFQSLRGGSQPWDLLINPLYSREYVADEVVSIMPAKVKIGVAGDNSNISRHIMAMTDPSYSALLPVDNSVVRHELHRNNEILSLLGSQEENIVFEAPLSDGDRQFAAQLLRNFDFQNFGIVFPGTKGGISSVKYWGSENYASLIDELHFERSEKVFMMLGGPEEEQIANEIGALAKSKPYIFQGELSIWQAAAVLEKAAYYVGSDTSVAHIAAALKIPTFVLLGGGHYGRFFPYPDGSSVTCLTNKLECFNCYWKCNQSYNKCIADISVAQVTSAMKAKLSLHKEKSTVVTNSFHIGTHRGSLPKVDLVLPPGMQAWHLKESWAITLEKAGCLNRVFRPTPETTIPLFKYLRSGGEADFLLALGGDHHLKFLHDTEEKREAWQKYRGHRVCNSFESTRDSLYKHYVNCVKNAMKTFTHFVFTDEVDANIFEAAKIPALWWPQAADARFFFNQTEFSRRKPLAFFCGKAWNEYPLRKMLLQQLQDSGLCNVAIRAAAGEMVANYNQHQLAINLPGVLGGFNVRTYEAMSCGSLLLQFLPGHRPANNALFQHGAHLLYYDYTDTEKLKATIQQLISEPQTASTIARRGHEELLAHHTIERRFAQLVDWLFDGRQANYPQYGEITPEKLRQSRDRRYVNDRYLFEDRPLWNSNAMNEFSDLQFLKYHAILPRLCQQGEQLALAKREVESLRVLNRALEADSDPDQVHNNLGVLYWNRGQRHKALEHFEAALAENPHYRPAIINYGEALMLFGLTSQARAIYSNYLQQHQADDGVKVLLSNVN